MGLVLQIATLFCLSPGDVKSLRSVINPHISRYVMLAHFLDVTNTILAFEYRTVVVAREVLDCLLFTSPIPKLGSSQSMVVAEGGGREILATSPTAVGRDVYFVFRGALICIS